MDPLEAIKATFFQECEELLGDLEMGLLALDAGDGDSETVNAVFRAVHSVKGGAGAFGLESLVRFAHVFETTLDGVRNGKVEAEPALLRVMLRAADRLADHVTAAKAGEDLGSEGDVELIQALESFIEPAGDVQLDDPGFAFAPMTVSIGGPDEDDAIPFTVAKVPLDAASQEACFTPVWTIEFRPLAALYRNANDALNLLRELERLGPIEAELNSSDVPSLEALDVAEAYLSWSIRLTADVTEGQIREVFEFVDGDCYLDVRLSDAGLQALAGSGLNEGSSDDGGVLPAFSEEVESGPVLTLAEILALGRAEVPADAGAGSLLSEVQAPTVQVQAPKPEASAAVSAVKSAPTNTAEAGPAPANVAAKSAEVAAQPTIRVDLDRVDRLIDLVGELVINQAMLAQQIHEAGVVRSGTIALGLDDLEQLTREIQDSVMAIRAQPVKSVFQRMPRLVREIASMTGKSVRLVTDGEGTEVDKTVIERLSDPLTHMIRNAVDHGLEDPEGRLAAGKPEEGVIRLSAQHRSGRIVIEVSDDGRGINRERVQAIAVSKGVIEPDAVLTEEEIDNLIFAPGFSTAAVISDISGRGVGMDVVKRSIQALGGRISIASVPGQGSTFTLSLPLTLAVLDGMVVSVGNQTLVVPITAIVETLQPKAADVRSLGPQGSVIAVRGAHVPLIDVAAVLGFQSDPGTGAGVTLLVESELGGLTALRVDAIQGQRQVVIKSLEQNYDQVSGIAAATILGDGRVALILDVDAVIARRRQVTPRPQIYAQAS